MKGPTKYLEKLVDKDPLSIHNFLNFTTLEIKIKKGLYKGLILMIRNQKNFNFSATLEVENGFHFILLYILSKIFIKCEETVISRHTKAQI